MSDLSQEIQTGSNDNDIALTIITDDVTPTRRATVTAGSALKVDNSAVTQPVSGTVAATQSGTWTVQPGNTANTTPWLATINQGGNSATVTASNALKVDGSAVTQPVSGTVTANQGGTWNINNVSGTVSLPTGAATEATLVKIPLAQGSTTSGQSGILEQGAVTTAEPSYTNAQTSPLSLTTAGRLRTEVMGNVASAATDSGNPVKTGGIINQDGSLFTNGQRANTQMDSAASFYVNISGRISSYSSFSSFTTAATATDIYTLTGSATKTIKVRSLIISGTNTGNTNALVTVIKRSTANTGGTSSTITAVANDSNNAAGTATARSYTVNPTLGTAVGTIEGRLLFLPTIASTNVFAAQELIFGDDGAQPITLRGTSEVFAVSLGGAALLGTTVMNVSLNWTEE